MKRVSKGIYRFIKLLFFLFIDIRFLVITVIGNSLILIIATIMFNIENGINPGINTFLDSLWWSVSTITTVGYGDVVPITNSGKILGLLTMIFGAGIFAIYTGLFAQVFFKDLGDTHDKHIREELYQIKYDMEMLRKERH